EQKKLELRGQAGGRLSLLNIRQDMSDWVLYDPTGTSRAERAEYVAQVTIVGEIGLFAHQSEHVSFETITPTAKIRLSHGRLHQLPMRDPADQFDLPDHLAWQMNLAIDRNEPRRHGHPWIDACACHRGSRCSHHAGHGRHPQDAGGL
ncbi:MAG: hypothetical protein ABJI00_17640, partial [Paracoccaceae bacterium]